MVVGGEEIRERYLVFNDDRRLKASEGVSHSKVPQRLRA